MTMVHVVVERDRFGTHVHGVFENPAAAMDRKFQVLREKLWVKSENIQVTSHEVEDVNPWRTVKAERPARPFKSEAPLRLRPGNIEHLTVNADLDFIDANGHHTPFMRGGYYA
ncbi:hypothetical protein QNA24_29915 [Rhodococcus qingshengii]|uniref:hypothetical protein n=1 Tax=Rhodococcus TaxID=1827 RepID=UPI001E2E63C7|nr:MULTISPECIES: hypothetical protein [Rhodococcus]MCD2099587.1 hypothetical protein [Rhodococcus rhodochrous]MCD2123955.1 hypothetical protein [Rhodococcus rhodochrous]MCQ4136616.1 hypothetical protein [Rhodococcus rhodochrous]MDJ0490600.1 hypothetical protein [Rhodococcus qingshengii]